MKTLLRTLAVTAAATGLVLGAAGVAQAGPQILDRGHVDVFGVEFHEDHFHLHIHGDDEYDPSHTLLKVRSQAETEVPDDDRYDFLGETGDPVWILPDSNDPELLFAGWGGEELDSGVFVDDTVTLRLHDVDGAGEFSVYTVDAGGEPTVHLDSDDPAPNTLAITAGGHGHVNWGFSAAGFYQVSVSVEGMPVDGGETVESGIVDYWFYVEAAA